MTHIRGMTREELRALDALKEEAPYVAAQLFDWLHRRRVSDFAQMSNLPKRVRGALAASFSLTEEKLLAVQESSRDGTRKYLFEFADEALVESVRMPYRFGDTVCVSSQAGCAMDCAFCASAEGGLLRSLAAAEMLRQVYAVADDAAGGARAVTHVVVMGSGEPLSNYDSLVRFVTLLTDPKGMGLSRRHVTVSTCGIVPRIYDLARDLPQINLAISLHAPTQALRERIMPVAKRYPLRELMAACREHVRLTGRRITFEYALMHGLNDGREEAGELAALLADLPCVVNLIPVNPARGGSWTEPKRTDVLKFKKFLELLGINVTIRREMGRDIDGACGQLKRRYREEFLAEDVFRNRYR